MEESICLQRVKWWAQGHIIFNLLVLTETGGICISPRPSAPGAEIKPAMPMRPFLGVDPVLMDPHTVSKSFIPLLHTSAFGSL